LHKIIEDQNELETKLQEKLDRELHKLKTNFEDFKQKVSTALFLNRRFEMRNFSVEKENGKLNDWKSPAMYTHVGGYKFWRV